MSDVRRFMRAHTYAFVLVFVVALIVANLVGRPDFGDPKYLDANLAGFAPLAILAMANTPPILSGGNGIDISLGPLANALSVILILYLFPSPLGGPVPSLVIVLVLGAAVGALNGLMVAVLRYRPVLATLCMYFVLAGVILNMVAQPEPAPSNWTSALANNVGPIPGPLLTMGAPALIWILLGRLPYRRTLLAVGGSAPAALSAGVNVTRVRIIAYALGGLFAGCGAIAVTAVFQATDATIGTGYTLIALAAVLIGGTPLRGGRGGLLGSFLGAAALYLIENLLLTLHITVAWLQIVYGLMILVGIILSSQAGRTRKRKNA